MTLGTQAVISADSKMKGDDVEEGCTVTLIVWLSRGESLSNLARTPFCSEPGVLTPSRTILYGEPFDAPTSEIDVPTHKYVSK